MARLTSYSLRNLSWALRKGITEDARILAAIDDAASAHPWRESQFALSNTGTDGGSGNVSLQNLVVAHKENSLIGFLAYSMVLDEAEILNIAVHPNYQGLGVACSLLNAALTGFRSAGVKRCLLEVRESNAPARSLYENLEFQVDGVRKNYYPSGTGREDALLMSKLLLELSEEGM